MNDAERYMRWLEEMWDVHKFDPHGSTEREEKRKEEALRCSRASTRPPGVAWSLRTFRLGRALPVMVEGWRVS